MAMKQEVVEGTEIEEEYSCCDGKIYFINQKKQALITFVLTTVGLVLHTTFNLEWFSTRHYFFPLYVLFGAIFTNFWAYMVILTSNPGIVQKINYEYENDLSLVDIPKNEMCRSHIQISNVLTAKTELCKIKLCHTCNIYRPARTHHCSLCGVCIERLDHHCPWLGGCIGKLNYRYFMVYLITLTIVIIDTLAMSLAMMVEDSKAYAVPIIMCLICLPALVFVGFTLGFHIIIAANNLTTKEYLDEMWNERAGNPYKKDNILKNYLKTIFNKSQREVKFKYVQYLIKSDGQSDNNPSSSQNNSYSGGKKNSQSNSDQHNYSKARQALNKQSSEQNEELVLKTSSGTRQIQKRATFKKDLLEEPPSGLKGQSNRKAATYSQPFREISSTKGQTQFSDLNLDQRRRFQESRRSEQSIKKVERKDSLQQPPKMLENSQEWEEQRSSNQENLSQTQNKMKNKQEDRQE